MAAVVRVGVSGWQYASWRDGFYPTGLAARDELAYAAERFSTLEVNATFYALARPSTFLRWREAVPPGHLLAVKGGRFITHMRRLRDVRVPLANFFASGVLALGDRLGPVLWQLPENLPFDGDVLDGFLSLLPQDTEAARELASASSLAADRRWSGPGPVRRVRHALEVRHPSYRDPAVVTLLRRHAVSLVASDSPMAWPSFGEVTSDLAYVRLHGHQRLYGGSYPDDVLRTWAARAREWVADGVDVFVYFNNDADGCAPFDAERLAAMIAGPAAPSRSPAAGGR